MARARSSRCTCGCRFDGGPDPISALIHAATMGHRPGIFMVARMSPLFELSAGGVELHHRDRRHHRAVHGFPRIVQNDIKRVGRVLDAVAARLHDGSRSAPRRTRWPSSPDDARLLQGAAVPRRRQRDHRPAPRPGPAQHGGLRRYMPVTWITALLGSLALIGTPLFPVSIRRTASWSPPGSPTRRHAGRELRLRGGDDRRLRHASTRSACISSPSTARSGSGARTTTTATRTKKSRPPTITTAGARREAARVAAVVTLPLILLAIPSVVIGFVAIDMFLFGDFFKGASSSTRQPPAMSKLAPCGRASASPIIAAGRCAARPDDGAFWLAAAGVALAWFFF